MREWSRTFGAMNTDVETVIIADEESRDVVQTKLDQVEALFADVEAALSRFRPDSELSRLNRSAGTTFVASHMLCSVVDDALAVSRKTDGLFDPTILGALLRAGYDRSFELLSGQGRRTMDGWRLAPRCTWRDVSVDKKAGTIRLPVGCGLDLGGFAKGWAVDQAALLLRGFTDFAVDAGGDIFAAGCQADGGPWTIGVEDPFVSGRDVLTLSVRDRAVATSSVMRRRWLSSDREAHHLIDPRTGEPSDGEVAQATVVACSVVQSETLTKAALLLGPVEGLSFLQQQPDAEGLLVLIDGKIRATAGLLEVERCGID